MNAERRNDEEAIFYAAIKLKSSEERRAYIKGACGEDRELLGRVEALLDAHEGAGDFLDAPPVNQGATLDSSPRIDGPGTVIGRYQLLELIGEGGMGLVYLAEQKEPVRRKVAFKIVKPGMDSKQVIARFEAERQALAVLDHPNIAHVYDAGCTETGRPYFVMEHVKGMSITRYCDEHKLTIEQRLRLFEQVCEGVQHAHQKGIIHRDLKPSNILVTMQGDKPVPKIIDFGIAKATTQSLTDATMFTYQGQFLGTPEYMSPEQADMSTQDIDTRSDIYSLGVVLYELLAGVLPFESESFTKIGLAEIQRTIREIEPASPSVRLTQMGDMAKGIAESRGTQVVPLARRLHRELEWIPLKAMRKDRCRRYKSASDMADDVRNYLNGNPLLAGPETAMYRVQKFVRKHAGSVATVALVVVAVVVGLVFSTAMYFQADDARGKEAMARGEAEQATAKEAAARGEAEQARAQAEQSERIAREQKGIAETKAEDLRRALYANSIQLADAKYREGNTRRVRELLESCPNDLRGWEWDRLNYMRDESITTLSGTSDESTRPVLGKDDCIYAAILNPDGKQIVSGHLDGTIRVWDSVTGKKLKEFLAHREPLESMAASSNGQRVASLSWDRTIKVWDTEPFKEIVTIGGGESSFLRLAISPDGRLIASVAWGEKVSRVWDAQTGSELFALGNQKSNVKRIIFGPDGKYIISGDEAGDITIWDVATARMLSAIHAHPDSIRCVTVSSDGAHIASVGGWDGQIKVWDMKTGAQLVSFQGGQEQVVESLAFSPDGKCLVSGLGNHIKIWGIETGRELRTLCGHEGWLTSLAFSRDGKRIISSSWDGTAKLWDVSEDRRATRLMVDRGSLNSISMAFRPDGKRIASNTDGMVKVWDADACVELMTVHGRQRSVMQYQRREKIAFSPDGRLISSTIPGGMIKVWDAETGVEVATLRVPGQHIWDLAFSPDSKRIVSASINPPGQPRGAMKVWAISSGREVMALPLDEILVPTSVAFSPDNKYLISGLLVVPDRQGGDVKERGAVKVWDASSGTEVRTMISQDGPVLCVAFSPDGKLIASGNHIVTAKVWDAATGAELMTLNGHDGAVCSVAFSPDGRRILTASDDKTARVWDVATGAELLSLPCGSVVHCATFNANGTIIGAGTVDGTIFLWDSNMSARGHEARTIGRNATQVVDELFQKYSSYHNVTNHLSGDRTSDESVHKLAMQIANARKWEDADKLRSEAWEVVCSSDKDVEANRSALEKAEKASNWEPNDPTILCTLGAAWYRTGAYKEALETLTRAGNMRVDGGDESGPRDVVFVAMALYKLGRVEEAKAAVEKVHGLLKDERFAEDEQGKALLVEAEGLMAGTKRE